MNIALIDKHPMLRNGMVMLLQNSFSNLTIVQGSNLHTYNQNTHETFPDILILGLSEESPEVDLTLIQAFKNLNPASEIVILADTVLYENAVASLASGIKGYISKRHGLSEVLKCMTSVINGKRYVCPEVTDMLIEEYLELKLNKDQSSLPSD